MNAPTNTPVQPTASTEDGQLTQEEQMSDEQREEMKIADSQLKQNIAELESEGIETISEAALLKKPEETARKLLKLYGDYRKVFARMQALENERKVLSAKAARTTVLERRLSNKNSNQKGKWIHLPSYDNEDEGIKAYGAMLGRPMSTGPALLKIVKDGQITLHKIDRATIYDSGDGVFDIESK